MEQPPRAVMFDLDGTLAESKQAVTPQMGAALAALMARMSVAVISGGSYAQFERQLLPALPADAALHNLYLFPVSASRCYVYTDGAWVTHYDHSLSSEERARVMEALRSALEETQFVQPEHIWGEQIEDRGSQITFSALGQAAPIEAKKWWDPDQRKRVPVYEALAKKLSDFSVRINATSSIDITRKGLDKTYGVEQFSHMVHVPVSDMLYVGDALFARGNDEIVKQTGIMTRQVAGPSETHAVISEMLAATRSS